MSKPLDRPLIYNALEKAMAAKEYHKAREAAKWVRSLVKLLDCEQLLRDAE